MYNEFFGFHEKPFNITPDPRFFYANPAYDEAYASLLYGIQERKGFIALIGEVGTGKTTLLRRLLTNLSPPNEVVYLCYSTPSFEEFLTFICVDLGLEVEGKGYLGKIQALNNFLLSVLKKGGTGVLLVDEAQNLGEAVLENLRLLSNIETATEKLLQIILVGQPELERKLARPSLRQLKQRIAVQCRLDRLKEREVGPFIFSRLRTVGYETRDLFPPDTIHRIALYSRGTPRLVNIICDNALLIAYSNSQKVISPEIVDEVARDLQLRTETSSRESTKDKPSMWQAEEPGLQEKAQDPTFSQDSFAEKVTLPKVEIPKVDTLPPVPQGWTPLPASRGTFLHIIIGALLAFLLLPAFGIRLESAVEMLRHAFPSWRHSGSRHASPSTEIKNSPAPTQPNTNTPTPKKTPSGDPPDALAEQERLSLQGLEETSGKVTTEQQTKAPSLSSVLENGREKQYPFVIAQSGTTVSAMVQKTYGNLNLLAIDLVKEFNPHIQDLDHIQPGEKIWLPPLTRETLVRQQEDGSYYLVLASFRSELEAEKFSRKVNKQGYETQTLLQRVSRRISLRRVTVVGLADMAAVDQAWKLLGVQENGHEPLLSDLRNLITDSKGIG